MGMHPRKALLVSTLFLGGVLLAVLLRVIAENWGSHVVLLLVFWHVGWFLLGVLVKTLQVWPKDGKDL